MSPGNVNETWENVRNYATLPSVREILIVHSTRVKAELMVRRADGALPADPTPFNSGGRVPLTSIDFAFDIADAYVATHLA